jgi:opacity protein-like surface antigen
MRRIIFILPLLLGAENYEEKYYKDKNHHPSKMAIHTDLGYSSYMIELHSSEIDSAIDYDILEFTLGGSYSYDDWMWGLYSRFMVNEFNTNMSVTSTDQSLGDRANIDREEYAIYSRYIIKESDSYSWKINGIFRISSLDATDSYRSYNLYSSQFRYNTQDLALSLGYSQNLDRDSLWFANGGILYSRAKVEMSESINSTPQDSFVDDSSSAIGIKLSLGYSYRVLPNLFLTLRGDFWQSDFDKLKVESRVGDTLPKASLEEKIYSIHTGVTITL